MQEMFDENNLLYTIMDKNGDVEIFKKFIDSIGTLEYNSIRPFINKKTEYDYELLNELNKKIKDEWYIDIIHLYDLDESEISNSFSIFVDILDVFNKELPDVIVEVLRKNGYNTIDQMDDMNEIIKLSRGKLKSILKVCDVDDIHRIIQKCFEVYQVYIVSELRVAR